MEAGTRARAGAPTRMGLQQAVACWHAHLCSHGTALVLVRFVFACIQAFHTGELGLTKDGDQPPEAAEITNQLEAVSV